MLRAILAVILSYIAMVIVIIAAFMGLWYGLGPNRLLQPGSFKGNTFLCIAAPSLTIITGLFGGWMCAKIGRGRRPVMVLAGVVFVLGMVLACITLQTPERTGPRDPNMTVEQILKEGREPTWVAISNPIIGAVAVLVGGLFLAAPRKPG